LTRSACSEVRLASGGSPNPSHVSQDRELTCAPNHAGHR